MNEREAAARLQQLFDRQIPLARAMQVQVSEWDGRTLRLEAPLECNLNHHGTAFGGSLYSLGLLAGWGALTLSLWAADIDAEVVVRQAGADYRAPVSERLSACCVVARDRAWQEFLQGLERHGRARLQLESAIEAGGSRRFRLELQFVARLVTL